MNLYWRNWIHYDLATILSVITKAAVICSRWSGLLSSIELINWRHYVMQHCNLGQCPFWEGPNSLGEAILRQQYLIFTTHALPLDTTWFCNDLWFPFIIVCSNRSHLQRSMGHYKIPTFMQRSIWCPSSAKNAHSFLGKNLEDNLLHLFGLFIIPVTTLQTCPISSQVNHIPLNALLIFISFFSSLVICSFSL